MPDQAQGWGGGGGGGGGGWGSPIFIGLGLAEEDKLNFHVQVKFLTGLIVKVIFTGSPRSVTFTPPAM